jgi:hypothetical protein
MKKKDFILIVGPPAVGKMTIGKAIADKLDYVLFHNHHSIELSIQLFEWGTPGFKKINEGIRALVFETAAKNQDIKGIIFTLVMAFELDDDWNYIEKIIKTFDSSEWNFQVLELESNLDIRLDRNKTPFRLSQKASKRNLDKSEENLKSMGTKYRLNSNEQDPINQYKWLKINNTNLSPDEVAIQTIAKFSLH